MKNMINSSFEIKAKESEGFELKDKIIEILMEELSVIYCDSCDGEYCEDCNRKEMNWGIGYHKAEKIADRILN